MSSDLAILLGALAFDLLIGEPPAAFHPVVWMGHLHHSLRRWAPASPGRALLWGAAMAIIGPIVFAGAAWWLMANLGGPLRWFLGVYLLKSAFSIRGLASAAARVRRPLQRGDIATARRELRGLVSRDTAELTPPLVAAAAIESVAENCSDSIVGPLFFFAVAGVPGALAYRAINTLDSMIGYRGELEWLGKAAARLDDVANLLPARVTALLLALAAPIAHGSSLRALLVWVRDRGSTASPNAGHPMATMAGALGVELEKVGHYRLGGGRGARLPEPGDIQRAVHVMAGAAAGAILMTVLWVMDAA